MECLSTGLQLKLLTCGETTAQATADSITRLAERFSTALSLNQALAERLS